MVCPCELLEEKEKQWVFKKRVPDKAFKWLSLFTQASLFIATLIKQDKNAFKEHLFWISGIRAKDLSLLIRGSSWKASFIFSAWLVFGWNRPITAPYLASAFGLFAHEIDLIPRYHQTASAFSFFGNFSSVAKNVKILILILGTTHWTAKQKKWGT